ncbi:3662_t:CDS:1, partial [Acaulospora morrowiae]
LQTLAQFDKGSQSELHKQLDILDAINMLIPAWEMDVSINTIINCWKHCGLTGSTTTNQIYEVNKAIYELGNVLTRIGYDDTIPAQELVNYDGEQKICEIQTEKEFFASLQIKNLTTEKEEDKDDTIEHPHYTSQQVREALEVLQGYAMQRGDENGEGRKAIDLY